ncbi:Uncharacterised protein [Vibrio cholerae]|nr:Uncharacterised protein [Vibrio cholerae]
MSAIFLLAVLIAPIALMASPTTSPPRAAFFAASVASRLASFALSAF